MSTVWAILERKGSNFWFIDPTASVLDAVRRLHEKKIGALIVMDGDRLAGIFSERDFVRLMAVQGAACLTQPVGEVMTSEVYVVRPGTTVDECMALMSEKQIRHLPVMAGKEVVGVVSNRDVVVEAIAHRESLLTGMDILMANREFPT
jgi:CBS domain-containing protein